MRRELGLVEGEIFTVDDLMERGRHDDDGDHRILTETEGRAAVAMLTRTAGITDGLIDQDTIDEAIETAVSKVAADKGIAS